MISSVQIRIAFSCLALSLCSLSAVGDSYSPYAGEAFPRQVFWGDTHLHSSYSADASAAGNVNLDPVAAYRFARGEAVTAHNGMQVQLIRPLDFLVVSDHAEYLGMMPQLRAGNPEILATPTGKRWFDMLQGDDDTRMKMVMEVINSLHEPKIEAPAARRTAWDSMLQASDDYNEPGRFTALSGYEWTSMPDRGNNLHRVVVFRDGADKTSQILPFSAFDSENPEDLWRFLERYERDTGGSVMAIPHNSNLSNGLMFQATDYAGNAIDRKYAQWRLYWEPVMEVTQIKGDSETHPLLSPDDEFADYGTWDRSNLLGSAAKQNWMLGAEYARSAMKLGLKLQARTGVNPYQFGMIGSSDAHTGLAAVREDNYWGKVTLMEPNPKRVSDAFITSQVDSALNTYAWEQLSSGYAAVWARENSREGIFDALRRREVYATTGSRITVRFFGGWEFEQADLARPDLAKRGYAVGVPMGGELAASEDEYASPGFLVSAQRDPEGANLDRIQIIKGWLDENGEANEQVYDVAWAGERRPGPDGKIPGLGSSVAGDGISYSNSIGAPLLSAVWTDPEFSAADHAFYYVRVIEIPTPRWSKFDEAYFDVTAPEDAPATTQERAYTSAIWYVP
ncbi:MAG: DUF3604 domain-containing protein [Gammaproteobacteria bacterium]|nr:DUF3604 domain-containing protein [Gammaproteobacteria bacterium]